ncbi:MAG: DNA repair protein RadA [Bacteroidetes bacterium]|nr:DNA repair protein RadA [Bacteroidota bacterium]MCW5894862.1 DNA repair protein RadA [Bacteroidota bacterium]
MSRVQTKYVCQSCAYESPRWIGKCPNCDEWNTFVEEITDRSKPTRSRHSSIIKNVSAPVPLVELKVADEPRLSTGIPEFDRVLGGGIVAGSVVLIGGDPGIGKSTLMMQMGGALTNAVVLYITGEESVNQIKLRSERLEKKPSKNLLLLAETSLHVIDALLEKEQPDLIIVDSIQTMYRPELESAPGTVSQVREATALFMRYAKSKGTPVFLVGHVTKDGVIAGPKVVEHMVDTVLQFEGEQHYAYRILRAIKNRFGSTNEIGIFEMHNNGLREVTNPSEVFLSQRKSGTSGSAVVASMEGTRPLLLEVQALVAPTSYGVPQRSATGFDSKRLQMLLAVLEKRVGLHVGQYDVFVNVAGGVKAVEPAIDLGMALSIVSSLRDIPVEPQTVAIGEIGLGGEIRTISQIEKRIAEAKKLGFRRILIPKNNLKGTGPNGEMRLIEVDTVDEAMRHVIS